MGNDFILCPCNALRNGPLNPRECKLRPQFRKETNACSTALLSISCCKSHNQYIENHHSPDEIIGRQGGVTFSPQNAPWRGPQHGRNTMGTTSNTQKGLATHQHGLCAATGRQAKLVLTIFPTWIMH